MARPGLPLDRGGFVWNTTDRFMSEFVLEGSFAVGEDSDPIITVIGKTIEQLFLSEYQLLKGLYR